MREGVKVSGIKEELARITSLMNGKRAQVKSKCFDIKEDMIRKSKDNAPYREGELSDSIDGRVIDHGIGHGLTIIISAGDKPYANRMHESHYQAYPRQEVTRKRSRKTGHYYYKYNRNFRTAGGFWIDSKGNKHGRKYLTRAYKDNWRRYQSALEAIGDRR